MEIFTNENICHQNSIALINPKQVKCTTHLNNSLIKRPSSNRHTICNIANILRSQKLSLAGIYSCLSRQFWSSWLIVGSNNRHSGGFGGFNIVKMNEKRKNYNFLQFPSLLPELARGSRKRKISRALGEQAVVACCNADCQSNTVGGRHNASLFGLALVCPTSLPPSLILFYPLSSCGFFSFLKKTTNYIEKKGFL